MRDRASTVRSRELGEGLRQAMEGAYLNGKQAARVLGWSESWVSRILSDKRGRRARRRGVPRGLPGQGPGAGPAARTVPGPAQPRLAAAARLPAARPAHDVDQARGQGGRDQPFWQHPAGEVEKWVTARLARQLLFSQERPARFTFYLHESVLYTPVGDPAVMSDQLHHLLRMSVRSHVTVRVVPAALGAHAAMAGSFIFMEFTEFRPLTYLESTTSSLFLQRPEETAAYRSILAALAPDRAG